MRNFVFLFLFVSTLLHADNNQKLVSNFCYALQASMHCDSLKMRADTQSVIEEKVGGEFRGPGNKYSGDCMSGLMQAIAEEDSGLCESAWIKFGCSGEVEPNLIQQNPFKLKNPILCSYP